MSGNRAERRSAAQRPAGPPPGRYGSGLQRRALAPAVLAAGTLIGGGLLLVGQDGYLYIRFAVCALALITTVFAAQSIRPWTAVVPAVIAVLWNPVLPFGFAGQPFRLGHVAAAVLLLVVGLVAPYRDPDHR